MDANGSEAEVVLECARHIARLQPEEAARWWRGEGRSGEPVVMAAPDGHIALQAAGKSANVSLELLRWAIEGAYAEHLGDFARWMFATPPKACIAGEGDRDAAASLEPSLAKFAEDVAAKTLPPATESARRGSLIAQIETFGLLSEPLLAEKYAALIGFGCPALARCTEAARQLADYFAGPIRAQMPVAHLGLASPTRGVLSLDFPNAAPAPAGSELHRWWAFCEMQFVIAQRDGLPDTPGVFFASAGGFRGKLYFRIEDGKRQVLHAATGSR
ncbi:MAG: hypothetical protein ABJE66_04505 [Deltaproteobacteria bacterium]